MVLQSPQEPFRFYEYSDDSEGVSHDEEFTESAESDDEDLGEVSQHLSVGGQEGDEEAAERRLQSIAQDDMLVAGRSPYTVSGKNGHIGIRNPSFVEEEGKVIQEPRRSARVRTTPEFLDPSVHWRTAKLRTTMHTIRRTTSKRPKPQRKTPEKAPSKTRGGRVITNPDAYDPSSYWKSANVRKGTRGEAKH